MCGLCGYIGSRLGDSNQETRLKVLTGLLVANRSRGDQSAGVCFIDKVERVLVKRAVDPIKFINSGEYQDVLVGNDFPIALGHTRLAVIGDVNDKNAQPFIEGKITGIHNGIINNHLEIDNKLEVDSQVLFSELNRAKNDYKSVCPRLAGSVASVWHYADNPEAIYLVRHENPIALAYIKSIETWFWSSETEALQSLLVSHYGAGSYKMFNLKADKVYCIRPRGKITKENVSFKPSPVYTPYTLGAGVHAIVDYDDKSEGGEFPNDNEIAEWVLYSAENEGCHSCGKVITDSPRVYYDEETFHAYCEDCSKGSVRLKLL